MSSLYCAYTAFGSNAAAWWSFHYNDLLTEPKPREVVTIYEIDASGSGNWARAVHNFRWAPQIDPFGVVHERIDYPGVPIDHALVKENHGILRGVHIPIRPHFGVIAAAPKEAEFVDSIPPGYFGGNIDDWRIGKGAVMFYPVAVPGALFSVGDPHASQGDSELCGTAIECSLTGTFQLLLHKRDRLARTALSDLHYPLLETPDEWVVHGFSSANYLAELGDGAGGLERGDRQFGLCGDEFRHAGDAGARSALRHGRRIHGRGRPVVGLVGAWGNHRRCGWRRPRRPHQGACRQFHRTLVYRTRGPLNSGPCVQSRPVIAQAGGSPRGREFAARHADTIVAHPKGVGAMKSYRDDVRARMAAQGRDPEACKVLFLVAAILGETEAEALEHKRMRAARAAEQIEQRIAFFGKLTNIDFSDRAFGTLQDRMVKELRLAGVSSIAAANAWIRPRWPVAWCARRWRW